MYTLYSSFWSQVSLSSSVLGYELLPSSDLHKVIVYTLYSIFWSQVSLSFSVL